MWHCPVCETKNTGLQCSRCGFDGSCDYEHYPSLGEIPSGVEAIARRREALREQKKDILHCPSCGSGQFRFDVDRQMCICTACGTSIPWPKGPGQGPEKKGLGGTAAKIGKFLPKRDFSFGKLMQSQPKQANSKVNPGKIQRASVAAKIDAISFLITILLGIISTFGLLLEAATSAGISLWVAAFISLGMLAHLAEKNVSCPRWLQWLWEFWRFDKFDGCLGSCLNAVISWSLLMLKILYFLEVLVLALTLIGLGLSGSNVLFAFIGLFIMLWHIVNLRQRK